ncbi:MAG TPA: hypothetical protein VFT99_19515 [Roseiflexaceae bacterium]|nr:hypothetical protein [Roseiflexaceae bacterium]
MEFAIIVITVGLYGLAIYLGLQQRTALYAVGLAAGQLSTVPSPLWQRLYGFMYAPQLPDVLEFAGHTLPRAIAFGGWALVLPPLIVVYLSQRRPWFTSYAAALLLFALFMIYFLLIEAFGIRAGLWAYTAPDLPFGIANTTLAALMNALTALAVLAALQFTRRYTMTSLVLFLLPVPLALRLLIQGLLGAPMYTVVLLHTYMPELNPQSWATVIGALGTLALLLWGVHLVAQTLTRQGDGVPV